MRNKKGFTLVELLAVIAILAILVIIALPNVMSLFNEAKQNSFTTELKEIAKQAEQQWMTDSMITTDARVYSKCDTCTGKKLNLSGRNNINYVIKLDKSGKIVQFQASDGTYQYQYNSTSGLKIEDIGNVQQISKLSASEIITITPSGSGSGGGGSSELTQEELNSLAANININHEGLTHCNYTYSISLSGDSSVLNKISSFEYEIFDVSSGASLAIISSSDRANGFNGSGYLPFTSDSLNGDLKCVPRVSTSSGLLQNLTPVEYVTWECPLG